VLQYNSVTCESSENLEEILISSKVLHCSQEIWIQIYYLYPITVLLNFIEKADVKLHARQNSPFGIGQHVNSSCGRFNSGTEVYVEFWYGDIWVP
jgi:hypothetical protein